MEVIYRIVLWTVIFCHYTWSQVDNCNNNLGMESRRIPDESITASSSKSDDRAPSFARIDNDNAWCSAPEDESPYIEILLEEQTLITAITTQGSSSELSWARKYQVKYMEKGKWKPYKEELRGNGNSRGLNTNELDPAIRTQKIRIYPKEPFSVMLDPGDPVPSCLRLELHGCSAPAACKDPGSPLNGVRNGSHFGHGKQITFACVKGFMLVGSATSVCHKGTWTHALPSCKATCDDPGVVVNGQRKGDTFIDGDSVEFTCDVNYSLIGSSIIRCLGGKWSSTLPQCKASCPDPGVPARGQRVGSSFGHGKHLQFICDSGYWLVGSQLIVCNEGNWSNDIPKCKAFCSDPGMPENGVRIGDDFGDGQMVAYRCNEAFNLVGSSTSFCIAGQWNSTKPTCKATCPDPGVPQDGRRIGANFAHGRTVTFFCLQDFSLVGSQSMTCHDGKWSSVLPVCKASCKDPGSPQNGVRHGNEFGHNKRISFTCLPGFQRIGSSTALCITGKWSASLPQCKAVCLDPGIPVNGNRIGNDFLDGQTVAFGCQPGHTLIGSQVLRCVAGKWDNDLPECKAPCPDPGVPRNGSRSGDDFRHAKSVTFSCKEDYELEGDATISCSNGDWTSKTPLCKIISCKDPGSPLHGRQSKVSKNFIVGGFVRFKCSENYTMVGKGKLTCLKSKAWNGEIPKCLASCPDPGHPENGQTIGRNFDHNSAVEFECFGDRFLEGFSQAKCNNGHWDKALPTCRDCGAGLPLGMESRKIPDTAIKASSQIAQHPAHHGRLGGDSYWCSEEGKDHFIYLNLPKKHKITGARIQLKSEYEFKIIVLKGKILQHWVDFHYEKPSRNKEVELQIKVKHPFIAQSVRIRVLKLRRESICLRAEVYGCAIPRGCIMRGSAVIIKQNDRYQRGYVGVFISTKANLLEVFLPGQRDSIIVTRADVIQVEKPDVHELSIGKLVLGEDVTSPGLIRKGKIQQITDSVCTIKTNDETWKSDLSDIRIVKISSFCS